MEAGRRCRGFLQPVKRGSAWDLEIFCPVAFAFGRSLMRAGPLARRSGFWVYVFALRASPHRQGSRVAGRNSIVTFWPEPASMINCETSQTVIPGLTSLPWT